MKKEKFKSQLEQTTEKLVEFTREYCFNDFSNNYSYIIVPNVRTTDKHLNKLEITTLKKWNKKKNKRLSFNEVVDLLHNDNKVPLWINISIYESSAEETTLELFCSRRLREEKELMHLNQIPPFNLQVPLTTSYFVRDKKEKFDVNWRKELVEKKNESFIERIKRLLK